MTLPAALQSAVAGVLAEQGGGSRRAATQGMAAAYRAGSGSVGIDLAAYLVARLPATYAAAAKALSETRAVRPDFAPRSLLDAGSGPGTAAWAAMALWPDLQDITFLDNDRTFLDLAQRLARSGDGALASARAVHGVIQSMPQDMSADLVVAAYALAELPLNAISSAAERLWQAAKGMLVIVEPGTPQGFARVRSVREALLPRGAVPLAPCTHAAACPMVGEDWCHFSVRLPRSRAHLHAKQAEVPFEDEKFSYLILAREGAAAGGARILSPPRHLKHGVDFRLCTAAGLDERHIARRSGALYKRTRKLEWGGHMPTEEEDGT